MVILLFIIHSAKLVHFQDHLRLLKVTQKQFVRIVVENLYIKKVQNAKLTIRNGGQTALRKNYIKVSESVVMCCIVWVYLSAA